MPSSAGARISPPSVPLLIADGIGKQEVGAKSALEDYFRSPDIWYIAVGYCCFYYGTYFYVSWFSTYFLEYRHSGREQRYHVGGKDGCGGSGRQGD